MNRIRAVLIAALFASPAFAQWGSAPPASKPTPAPAPAPATPPTATAAPEPAPAQQPPPRRRAVVVDDDGSTGFAFGVRGAWAFPGGDLNATDTLGNEVAGQLPIWLEAGWRFTKNIYAGAYFQWGIGFNSNCNTGADCGTHGFRYGIEGIYNVAPDSAIQPWVGLGVGYETMNVTFNGADSSYKGWELVNIQLGADLAASKQFSIGPFASYSLFGKYSSQTSSGYSNDISAGHNWLQLGVKATVKL